MIVLRPRALLVAALLLTWSVICTGCDVGVNLVHSPLRTYIQEGATVEINCTAESSQFPAWAIQLPGQSNQLQFPVGNSRMTLNNRGFYELQEVDIGETRLIRLLINNTMGTNGSVVGCVDTSSGNAIGQTTLHIYVPTPLTIESMDVDVLSINVSWSFMDMTSSLMSQDVNWTYSLLTVSTDSTLMSTLQLNDSHYVFSSQRSPSSCEIYNFSVTATPVGATYTGDGCSVPSPVFSTMLPSLPDTRELESSMNYSLTKVVRNEDTAITLTATFMPADSCVSYPVTNYTLEFTQGPVPDSLMLTSTENSVSLTAHNLMENSVYKFKVVVSNSVGNVSTSEETIYTTDLQRVVAVQTGSDSISVQCDFITGSDAQGCMVVLESEADNTTITLSITREEAYTIGTINTTRPLNCYHKVFGFDIESNGSVGTLPVPGELMVNNTNIDMCMAEQPSATASRPLWIIGVVLALMLALVVLLLMVVVCVRRKKSRYNFNPSTLRPTESQSPTDDHTYICDQSSEVRCMGIDNEKEDTDGEVQASMPVYDAPVAIRKQDACHKSAGQVDYCTIENQEHFYHVLEQRVKKNDTQRHDNTTIHPDPDAPPLPPPFQHD